MKIVQARHEGSNKNYYFVTTIEGLKKGDDLIVDTKFGIQKAIFYSYIDFESLDAKLGVPNKNVIAKVDALNRSYWDSVNIVSSFKKVEQQKMIDDIMFEALEEMHHERNKKEMVSDEKINEGMRKFLKVVKSFKKRKRSSCTLNSKWVYIITSPLLKEPVHILEGKQYSSFSKLMRTEFEDFAIYGSSEYYNFKIKGYEDVLLFHIRREGINK